MINLIKVVAPTAVIKGIAVLSAFLMNLLVVRNLGVEDSGYFFWFFSLVLILGVVSRFGLDQGVVRIAASSLVDSKGKLSFFVSVFVLVLISSSIISIALFVFSNEMSLYFNLGIKAAEVIESGVLIIVLSSLLFLVSSFYQAEGRPISYVLYVSLLVPLLVLVFVILFEIDDIFELLYLYELVVFVVLLCSFILLVKEYYKYSGGEICFNLKGYSVILFGLWIVSIMMIINQWYGQVFISVYGSIADVAKFSVAQKVSMLFTSVTVVISARYSSLIIKSKGDWYSEYKVINKLVLLSFVLVVIVSLFSENILLVFGSEYVDQKYSLVGLVFSQWVNVFYAVQNWKIVAVANSGLVMLNGLALLFFNALYVFVFYFVVDGVILAVVLAMLAGNITAVLFQRVLIKRAAM